MNIAMVDDQAEDLQDAENFLREHLAKKFSEVAPVVRIDTFSKPEKFLSEFECDKYDLLIFDIFMKPLNGIQVAQIVRGKDSDVFIIFLTNSEEYILDGYKVFAVGYFLKPLAENVKQFTKTFDYIFPRLLANQKRVTVPVKLDDVFGDVSILHKNICYVDIGEYHLPCIHLTDRNISTLLSYEEIFDALKDDERFLECYHRIIVNMDFIKLMDGEDFVLTDGTRIPISRRKSKVAKLKYMSHLINTNPANTW